MSDTPETDGVSWTTIGAVKPDVRAVGVSVVDADFARRLERDRDDWKTKAILHGNVALDMEQDINKLQAINAELVGTLEELRDAKWLNMPGRANEIIENAINKANKDK